jgi:hypothetical protein
MPCFDNGVNQPKNIKAVSLNQLDANFKLKRCI